MKQDHIIERFYTDWCIAEFEADCIYDEVDEDFTHPRFLEAAQVAREALDAFLQTPTTSLHGVRLKLEIASDCEDYLTDALDPACTAVAPRAVIAATRDLEQIVAAA